MGFSLFALEGHLPPAAAACVKKRAGNNRHLNPQRSSCQTATLHPGWIQAIYNLPESRAQWKRTSESLWPDAGNPLRSIPPGTEEPKQSCRTVNCRLAPTCHDSARHVGVRHLCGTQQRPAEISLPGDLTSPGCVSRPSAAASHPRTVTAWLSGHKHGSLLLAAEVGLITKDLQKFP